MYSFKDFLILIEEVKTSKNKKKKPADNKKNQKKDGFVSNKEAVHGGMSYYSPGEL